MALHTKSISATEQENIELKSKLSSLQNEFSRFKKSRNQLNKVLENRLELFKNSPQLSLQNCLEIIIEKICEITSAQNGFLYLLGDDQISVQGATFPKKTKEKFAEETHDLDIQKLLQTSILNESIQSKKSIIYNGDFDETTNKDFSIHPDPLTRELAFPFLLNSEVLAIIHLKNRKKLFDDVDLEIISELFNISWQIIHQKKSAESFKLSSKWYLNILDNSPSGIIIIDHTFNIEYINKIAETILKCELSEIIGQDFRNLIADEDKEMMSERFIKRQLGEPVPEKYRFRAKRKDGTLRHLELVSLVMKTPLNEIKTVAQVIDITEQLDAEKALEQSELHNKIVIENSPDGIINSTLEGKVLALNQKAIDLFGFKSLEEALDLDNTIMDFISKGDRDSAASNLQKLINDDNQGPFYYKLLRRDGTVFHSEVTAALIKNTTDLRHSFVVNIRDISDRIQTTDQLSNMLLAANDGMWDWNLETNIVDYDKRYFEMAGYENKEFSPNFDEFEKRIHPDDLGNVMKATQEHLDGKSARFSVEFRFLKKNKEWMWILGRGIIVERTSKHTPKRLVGTHTDISEFKKIQEHSLKLSKAIEQSPEGIVITNKEGIIEYINPRFTKQTGFETSEVIGKTPRILKSGKYDPAFYKEMWDTILSGKTWSAEMLNKRKNTTTYWERVLIAPLIQEDGEISHFVSIREDISIKKKMLNDLKEAKDKAEESDSLKSAFLANMSHEIRTPMNGIIGFANLLGMKGLSNEQRDEYLRIIKKSGDRMLNTINDIIDISKVEAGQVEITLSEANINDHLKYLYNFFNPEVEKKNITLTFAPGLPDENVLLKCDHEKFIAISTNLIKNAIKYSNAGSIKFGYSKKGNELEFYVSDTGIGIAPNRQKAIFERFVQADLSITKPYEGSGLGLSISKAFVELMGGEIWVESVLNKGSVFYFTIPYVLEPKLEIKKDIVPSELNQMEKLKTQKILIAEDDESAFFFLSEILKKNCAEIMHATTGKEAVDIYQDNQDIALILMDMKMPEMDGYKASQIIREINKDVIIVGQTAYALVGDKIKVLNAGCNEYITKPIEKRILFQILNNYF